jgi:hypothetical protein
VTGAWTGRSGAVLLEVVLAIAMFVTWGTAILVLEDRSITGLQRARHSEQARDLACSAMARLECGTDTRRTLAGPVKPDQGFQVPTGEWELKVQSEPSQFPGLTTVSVTASRRASGRADAVVASYTLRQLVRFSELPADRPGPDDPLLSLAGAPASNAGAKP